jgi:hypothetical protein
MKRRGFITESTEHTEKSSRREEDQKRDALEEADAFALFFTIPLFLF